MTAGEIENRTGDELVCSRSSHGHVNQWIVQCQPLTLQTMMAQHYLRQGRQDMHATNEAKCTEQSEAEQQQCTS
jgi:hypothetical protein